MAGSGDHADIAVDLQKQGQGSAERRDAFHKKRTDVEGDNLKCELSFQNVAAGHVIGTGKLSRCIPSSRGHPNRLSRPPHGPSSAPCLAGCARRSASPNRHPTMARIRLWSLPANHPRVRRSNRGGAIIENKWIAEGIETRAITNRQAFRYYRQHGAARHLRGKQSSASWQATGASVYRRNTTRQHPTISTLRSRLALITQQGGRR
jgi:hypothetical protein